jgi:hypothetical protein
VEKKMSNAQSKPEPLDLEDLFGPGIHSYSRAEALEDGVLIDERSHGVDVPAGRVLETHDQVAAVLQT